MTTTPERDQLDRPPLLLPINDAARELSVSRSHLYALITRGDIASVRVGSRHLVAYAELMAYVDRLGNA